MTSCTYCSSLYPILCFDQFLYRAYYMVAQRYEYYFRGLKTIFYKLVQRLSKILLSTQENNIYIFKLPCAFYAPVNKSPTP